jgi:hypothetical protein
MPTKPGSAFVHATDANFSSGPASGNPTKLPVPDTGQGYIPDTGIAAEHVNSVLNLIGIWLTDWVDQGTFDADEDAHIVETDGAGKIFVIQCEIGDAAKDATVLLANNASAGDTAICTNFGTGRAFRATASAANGLTEAAVFTGTRNAPAPIVSFFKLGAGGHQRGSIFMTPQDAPSTIVDGDVAKEPGSGSEPEDRGALLISDAADGGKVYKAWATEVGYRFSHSDAQSPAEITTTSNLLTLIVDLTVDPPPGKYKVTFSCSLKVSTGAGDKVGQVKFDTGVVGKVQTYNINFPDPDLYMPLSATWIVDITTTTTFEIRLSSPDDVTGIRIADSEIILEGAHDRMEIPAPPPP